jgi:hypothetical protein
MEPTSLHFAAAARVIGDAARRGRFVVPGFRSPPRVAGADRTIRRRADGSPTVSVRYRQRPWNAVLADLIEGVVVANGLPGSRADDCRTQLWRALEAGEAAAPDRPTIASAPTHAPTPTPVDGAGAKVHHLAA